MTIYKTREDLQNKIISLGENGKLNRPTSEVIAMPNWMLIKIIKLRK